MKLSSSIQIHANEGIPEEAGRGNDKWIEKVGTQFCIRSNGIDQNFGCWPSREKAEAVMAGKSFIEPDVNKSLKAKGKDFSPVTKMRDKMTMKINQNTGEIKMPKVVKSFNPKIKFKNPSPYRVPGEGKKASVGITTLKNPIKLGKPDPNPGVIGKIRADYGEPNAGAYQTAHMDSRLWFTPPSLAKRGKGTYVPTDNPNEKDDKFLDVTKRKEAHQQRMGLLKKSTPGGTPPNIPVRTTLISPTLNSYMPLMASAHRTRRRHGGGIFRAYGSAKI